MNECVVAPQINLKIFVNKKNFAERKLNYILNQQQQQHKS